jgi:GrpB-like predicted nucleotidyltransferase (UPF0157 family)
MPNMIVPIPGVLDEHVTLVPYDPTWAAAFAEERARLAATVDVTPGSLEHIGSTAVPGLTAKPIIDMMLGVPALPPDPDLLARLENNGYENLGEAGVPGRVYLRLRGAPAFNLHIVERGGSHWTNNLSLRALLLADPAARQRYAQGKEAALRNAGNRLLAYSAAKQGCIEALLSEALRIAR